jgi:hypothetical protein
MLFRMAILEDTRHKWVVYKIRYQRLKDRKSVEHFVGDTLGRAWDDLASAAAYAQEVHTLLRRIEFQQQIIHDPNEDEHIKLQSRTALTSLLTELTVLTGMRHT